MKQIQSAEEFVQLRDSDDPICYGMAAHGMADDSVWRDVIERYPHMKQWVAHNKTVSLAILGELANDTEAIIRMSAAVKRKLSPDLFDRLSQDQSPDVRRTLACNAKTPAAILQRLAEDPDEGVRQVAVERLRTRSAKGLSSN